MATIEPRSLTDVRAELADAKSRRVAQTAVRDVTARDRQAARAAQGRTRSALDQAKDLRGATERAYASSPSEATAEAIGSADMAVRRAEIIEKIERQKLSNATQTDETAAAALARVEAEIAALEEEEKEHPETVAALFDPLVARFVKASLEVGAALDGLRAARRELVRPGRRCGEHHALQLPLERLLATRGVVPHDVYRSALLEALSETVAAGPGQFPLTAVNVVLTLFAQEPCKNPRAVEEYRATVALRSQFHSAGAAEAYRLASGPRHRPPVDLRVKANLEAQAAEHAKRSPVVALCSRFLGGFGAPEKDAAE